MREYLVLLPDFVPASPAEPGSFTEVRSPHERPFPALVLSCLNWVALFFNYQSQAQQGLSVGSGGRNRRRGASCPPVPAHLSTRAAGLPEDSPGQTPGTRPWWPAALRSMGTYSQVLPQGERGRRPGGSVTCPAEAGQHCSAPRPERGAGSSHRAAHCPAEGG